MRARLFVWLLALTVPACTNTSSTEITAPTTVRCTVTVDNSLRGNAPPSGINGTITVTTTRDCEWSVASDVTWLTIQGATSGQGSGSVGYAVAANAQAASRRGVLDVNGTQLAVVQDPAPCRFGVSPANTAVSMTGGRITVTVESASGCDWKAQSSSGWITIAAGSAGNGNGTVAIDVAPNPGDARTGSVTIAGVTVAVSQSETPCTYTVSPLSPNIAYPGGGASVGVTVRPGCAWTATSAADWIRIASGASGSGNGQVSLQIASNPGNARSGKLTVAATTVTVAQAPAPCTFAVTSTSQNVPVGGMALTVDVSVRPGCGWSATSNAPWIAIVSGASGDGNGSVTFNVAPNPGPPRSGTLTIAGSTFTVSQATVPCDYVIAPRTQFIGGDGGTGTTTIFTGPTCPWTAAPGVPWITMIGAADGIGDGRVVFAIASNPGDARNGTLTVAGQTYTVVQSAAGRP